MVSYNIDDSLIYEILNFIANSPDSKTTLREIVNHTICSKLIFKKRLDQMNNQESYVIALAIDSAYRALRNEYELDEESITELRDYIFIYNKLEPLFSPLLENVK